MPLVTQYLRHVLFLILLAGLVISMLSRYMRIPGIVHLLEIFDKREDITTFPGRGAFFFLTGCLAAIILFERPVASASIFILTFGDPTSSFIGRYYGRTHMIISEKKLLEGTLAGIIAGTIAASFFVPWGQALICATAGMIVEAAELEFLKVDDNLSIPIAAGVALSIARMYL